VIWTKRAATGLIHWYKDGFSLEEISRWLGVHRTTLWRVIQGETAGNLWKVGEREGLLEDSWGVTESGLSPKPVGVPEDVLEQSRRDRAEFDETRVVTDESAGELG